MGVVAFDAIQMAVALRALIQNSIIAIGSQGRISIQIWKRSSHCLAISVMDDGPGIDETIAEQYQSLGSPRLYRWF